MYVWRYGWWGMRAAVSLLGLTFDLKGHHIGSIIHPVDDLALVLPDVLQPDFAEVQRGVVFVGLQQAHAAVEAVVHLLVEAHGHQNVELLGEVRWELGPLDPHCAAEGLGAVAVQPAGQGGVAPSECLDFVLAWDYREVGIVIWKWLTKHKVGQ